MPTSAASDAEAFIAHVLEGADHRATDAVQVFVEGIPDRRRIRQQACRQGAVLDRHHRAVGLAQALHARDLLGRREAEADQFVVGGQGDAALQPGGAGGEAFQAEHLAEAGETRQRLFETRRNEGAGAQVAADQPLLEEYFEGLARGDAGNVQGFAEVAFGGQRLLRFPLAGMDRALEIARQLQIEGGGLRLVGTQGQEQVVGCLHERFRCGLCCCRPVMRGKLIPLEYHVNASCALRTRQPAVPSIDSA